MRNKIEAGIEVLESVVKWQGRVVERMLEETNEVGVILLLLFCLVAPLFLGMPGMTALLSAVFFGPALLFAVGVSVLSFLD